MSSHLLISRLPDVRGDLDGLAGGDHLLGVRKAHAEGEGAAVAAGAVCHLEAVLGSAEEDLDGGCGLGHKRIMSRVSRHRKTRWTSSPGRVYRPVSRRPYG